jgi:uncharacterized membrane protein YdbT with pleckstrin-like domain
MNPVPKKFAKLKKSFIDRISGDVNSTASFCAFPAGVSFNGQDSGEQIILMVRRHPAVYIPHALLFLLLLISPAFLFPIYNQILGPANLGLWLGSSLVIILFAITLAVDSYLKWYYTVNIITDERIIDVDFNNILYHKFAEAQLEKIEDVSHKPVGIFSSIFDYGNVYIQTAGAKPEFVFDSVPRARDVQDTLLDLLELKQEGKI